MRSEIDTGPNPEGADISAELAGWLIAHGYRSGDINSVIENQTTPLMHACRLDRLDIIDQLLAAGADIGATNSDGNNALWLACFRENIAIIDRLLESGIAIDHQNDAGATCLMYAASSSKTSVVS